MGGNFLQDLGQGLAEGMGRRQQEDARWAHEADKAASGAIMEGLKTNPEAISALISTPEGNKMLKRLYGKEGVPLIQQLTIGAVKQQHFGKLMQQGVEERAKREAIDAANAADPSVQPQTYEGQQKPTYPIGMAERQLKSLEGMSPVAVGAGLGVGMGQIALGQAQLEAKKVEDEEKRKLDIRKQKFEETKVHTEIKAGTNPTTGAPANVAYQFNPQGQMVGAIFLDDTPESHESLRLVQQIEQMQESLVNPEITPLAKKNLEQKIASRQKVLTHSLERGKAAKIPAQPAIFMTMDPNGKPMLFSGDPKQISQHMERLNDIQLTTANITKNQSQIDYSSSVVTSATRMKQLMRDTGPGSEQKLYSFGYGVAAQVGVEDWVPENIKKKIKGASAKKALALSLAVDIVHADDPTASARQVETQTQQEAVKIEGWLSNRLEGEAALDEVIQRHTSKKAYAQQQLEAAKQRPEASVRTAAGSPPAGAQRVGPLTLTLKDGRVTQPFKNAADMEAARKELEAAGHI